MPSAVRLPRISRLDCAVRPGQHNGLLALGHAMVAFDSGQSNGRVATPRTYQTSTMSPELPPKRRSVHVTRALWIDLVS